MIHGISSRSTAKVTGFIGGGTCDAIQLPFQKQGSGKALCTRVQDGVEKPKSEGACLK
jgi:hypothetical protein